MLANALNCIKFAVAASAVTLLQVVGLPYFAFIDGMRALAVIAAIFFHLGLRVPGGYVGVDIFFVLSGFLITSILMNRLNQPAGEFFGHFYERRARRIIPALIVMSILCVIAAYFLLMPKEMQAFGKSLRNMAVFFSNFSFSREVGYFDVPAHGKPLLHTWSLAVEEQFYLVFPPLLYVLSRLFKLRTAFIGLVLGVIFAASLAYNITMIDTLPERVFFLPPARAWELLTGSLIALYGVRIHPPVWLSELLSVIAIVTLGVCMFGYTDETKFPGIAAVPPVLASALLIWANLKHTSVVARILSLKPIVYIGLISYGLYLYHWPTLVFTGFYYGGTPPEWTAWASLPFLFVLASLSFHLIEEPVRHGRWLRRRRAVLLWALVLLLATFGIGQALGKNGLPERLPDAVRHYSAAGDKDQYRNACHQVYNDPDFKGSACVIGKGDAKQPDFLVWGDSHAGALLPAMEVMAKQYGKIGWLYRNTGCPPVIETERIDERLDMLCRDASETAMSMIKKYHIKHVLMAGRWDMYAQGWEQGSEEVTREPQIEYNGKLGLDALSEALPATLAKTRALGAEPWIFMSIPPQLNDVPTALATAEHFGRDRAALRRDATTIREWRAPVLEVLTAEEPSHVLDPLPMFCPEGAQFCEIEKEGEPLYSDNDHLSIYGSKYLAPVFEPFFKSMQ